MQLGLERLCADPGLVRPLRDARVALLGHPASVTRNLVHAVDALVAAGVRVVAAFGPQHGMRGEKQDNMVESLDYQDPRHRIPVFSLYGSTRRLTPAMLNTFDVLVVDLQDIGTRIYTFLTTLAYVLEDCAAHHKAVWVLDRPNPAGRPIEGPLLQPGYESFVGAAPMTMRHGLTLGEVALWYRERRGLALELKVVEMADYDPTAGPGFGWPLGELPWVNPSPNAANLGMARAYPGTVLLEGTTLSEGRGTTRPLEVLGAPGIDGHRLLADMRNAAPEWCEGVLLRHCWFQPTFQKYAGQLCEGFQIHVDSTAYDPVRFRPYRLVALALKLLRRSSPESDLWRRFAYEYETDRMPIDLIDGGPGLRTWVDDPEATTDAFERKLEPDETSWAREREPFLLYRA